MFARRRGQVHIQYIVYNTHTQEQYTRPSFGVRLGEYSGKSALGGRGEWSGDAADSHREGMTRSEGLSGVTRFL